MSFYHRQGPRDTRLSFTMKALATRGLRPGAERVGEGPTFIAEKDGCVFQCGGQQQAYTANIQGFIEWLRRLGVCSDFS